MASVRHNVHLGVCHVFATNEYPFVIISYLQASEFHVWIYNYSFVSVKYLPGGVLSWGVVLCSNVSMIDLHITNLFV